MIENFRQIRLLTDLLFLGIEYITPFFYDFTKKEASKDVKSLEADLVGTI
jgi:hypothetical protein